MNAINHTEAQAIHATASAAPAVLLEAADPSKNLILVPLSRLVSRPTGRNVRKTPRMSIPELAASIQRVGLLQNLIVTATADGERYEVVAGGRRLAALKLLAKKRRISKEWEVPCLLVADGTARTASLTENVQREAMHPADQFEAFAALATPYLEPHELENAKVAAETTIVENGNWKLVWENNRECYHCNGAHPELLNSLQEFDDSDDPRATPAYKALVARKQADWDKENVPWQLKRFGNRNRLTRTPLLEGTVSMTMDGKQGCKKLMGRFTNPDMGSLRILNLPNSWNHFMGDHAVVFRVLPLGPQKTVVTTKWLVHKDAVEGVDYDPEQLRKVWDTTNSQDRHLAEQNQRGINSKAYQPGPYSKTFEFGVIDFIDWYSECMLGHLDESTR